MRVVADTNTIVSGLMWQGPPRRVLDLARNGEIELFTSAALLAELDEVLSREKFRTRLTMASVTANELVIGYASLAVHVEPAVILPVILSDADDDAVLACAVSAQAAAIVSGDSHL